MSVLRFFVLAALASSSTASNPHHPEFDYCDWLGQDDVQGLKHGFLAAYFNRALKTPMDMVSATGQAM